MYADKNNQTGFTPLEASVLMGANSLTGLTPVRREPLTGQDFYHTHWELSNGVSPYITGRPSQRDGLSLKGFTVVEVTLAMVVLSVGILAILSIIMACLYQEQTSREYDIASSAAVAKLEEIRGANFSRIYSDYNNTYFAVTDLTPQAGDSQPGYITIDNSNPNLLDVTVTISWLSLTGSNVNLDLAMKTMLARSEQ